SLSLPTRRPPSPPLFPYTTLFRSLSASRPVVGDRRAQREHGRPESRRDPTLVVGRRTDACPVRIETPSEGRDLRSIRKLRVHERSEEHTSELQSLAYLVCRLLPEK